ncbi:MAG TPA: ABC transporter permease [Verrucomicrobiae bacterium]|nr:ABC transporter permease [Verrucomicrobiae bacterium]
MTLSALRADLRSAVRSLLRAPGFTALAVATLALGIGANSAIFTVVNALLVRPLPYGEAERLVQIWEVRPRIDRSSVSPGEFLDWQARSDVFERLAAIDYRNANLTGAGEPEAVPMSRVSADWFPLLGIRPALGRPFAAEEDAPGRDGVVILSDEFWQRRFGGAASAVGSTVLLDGVPKTVIGVMAPGDRLPQMSALLEPVAFDAQQRVERGHHYLEVLGRLKPGVDLARARAGMSALAASLARDRGINPESEGVSLVPLQEQLYGEGRPLLLLLLGAVGLVLLIACGNVAGLMVARAAERERELAIRAALGATRRRLAWQRMAESLLLGVAGAAAGLVLALWGVEALLKLVPDGVERVRDVGVDGNVLLFTAATSILAGLVAGVAPALFAAGSSPALGLAEGGRGTGSRRRTRGRNGLVAAQMALSVLLLIGAGLLLRSFEALRRVDPGFGTSGRMAADLALPDGRYDAEKGAAFFRTLAANLESLPGIEAAGMVNVLPLSGSNVSSNYSVEGEPVHSREDSPNANRRAVAGRYFSALGLHLLQGRLFDQRDTASSPPVVIVNETFARSHWPGRSAVGRRMRFGSGPSNTAPWKEIVGVVADLRHKALDAPPRAEAYIPLEQMPASGMTVIVAAPGEPAGLVEAIRGTVRALDPDLPIANVRSIEEVIAGALVPQRLAAILVGLFAALAVLLAALGLYGVVAFSVARRTREIGVRMALGATRHGVLALVVRQGMRLAVAGVAIGLTAGWGMTRLLRSLLFGVSATDPAAFTGAALVLALVALVASFIPARRATRVEPVVALRSE